MLPVCPNCEGDVFLNVRGGSWFIDSPYQKQLQQFNNWLNNINDKNILVLDIGTGFNTPGVVKWPAENIVRKYSNSSLVRVNLYDARIADDIKDRSVSIDGDIAEFLTKIASS